MRIAIAADHNAVAMKSRLAAWLSERGHRVDDRGVHDAGEIADYPPLCADVGCRHVGARRIRFVGAGIRLLQQLGAPGRRRLLPLLT